MKGNEISKPTPNQRLMCDSIRKMSDQGMEAFRVFHGVWQQIMPAVPPSDREEFLNALIAQAYDWKDMVTNSEVEG